MDEVEAPNAWKEAVINACVNNFINWNEAEPEKTLRELIAWEVRIALDPKVSKAAQELVEKGKKARAEKFSVRDQFAGLAMTGLLYPGRLQMEGDWGGVRKSRLRNSRCHAQGAQ